MITLKFDFQSIEKGDNQEEKTGKITKKFLTIGGVGFS